MIVHGELPKCVHCIICPSSSWYQTFCKSHISLYVTLREKSHLQSIKTQLLPGNLRINSVRDANVKKLPTSDIA